MLNGVKNTKHKRANVLYVPYCTMLNGVNTRGRMYRTVLYHAGRGKYKRVNVLYVPYCTTLNGVNTRGRMSCTVLYHAERGRGIYKRANVLYRTVPCWTGYIQEGECPVPYCTMLDGVNTKGRMSCTVLYHAERGKYKRANVLYCTVPC